MNNRMRQQKKACMLNRRYIASDSWNTWNVIVVGITANGHSIYSFDPASRKAKRKRYSYRAWFNSVKEAIPDEYRNTILKAPPCSFIE